MTWSVAPLIAAGLLIVAFCADVILSWHGVGAPSGSALGLERIQYDTAWAFVFVGASLLAAAARSAVLTRAFATVPIVLGLLRIVAYVAPGSVAVRPILANPWLPFGAGAYNEMGLLTALLLIALGGALATLRPTGRGAVRSLLLTLIASITLALALLLLFGAWTGGPAATRWLLLTGADRTNALLAIVVAAALLAYASLGSAEERRVVWRWLPAIVWFTVFVSALVLWRTLVQEETRAIQTSTALVASDIRGRIERNLSGYVALLARLAARAPSYASVPERWQEDASVLLPERDELSALGWIDSEWLPHWFAAPNTPPPPSTDVRADPQLGPVVAKAISTRKPTLTGFFDIEGRGNGFALVVPAFDGDQLSGIAVAEMPGNTWFHALLRGRFPEYELDLDEGGKPVASIGGDDEAAEAEWADERPLHIAGATWMLRVTPTREALVQKKSPLPEIALSVGVVLATLLALCTWLFQMALKRARDLAGANARMVADMLARSRAEEALRDAERRTRLIVNAIKDCAIFMLEPDGRIASWNPGAGALTGYAESEALGRGYAMLYDEGRQQACARALEAAARVGAFEEEGWHRRRDGTRFCGEDIISAIRDDAGSLQGYSVITRDVTQRIEMQRQTERSRDFYFALFSDLPSLVWRSDANGACDYVNNAWIEFTGRARETQLGDGWIEAIHPDDRERWRDAYSHALKECSPFELEARLQRADGSFGTILCNARPYHDMQGRFSGFIWSCADLTARREMEGALKEGEARYEGIASNVPGMVFQLVRRTDESYAFAYVSPGCEPLTGASATQLRENFGAFSSLIPAGQRAHFDATLDASAANLANWQWSGPLRPAHEASEKWLSIRARPRQQDTGEIVWDGLVFDDTQNRLAQLEVERSREELRALSRHLQSVREEEKARIAREVHDELGATLTALKIDLGYVAERLPTNGATLREKCQSMSRLVDTAVVATRKIVSDLRPSLLDDLGLAAALAWQAGEYRKHANLRITVETPDPDVEIERDAALTLFRIFQEALTNVARHAKASEVAVTLSESATGHALTIRDNGAGITEDAMAKPSSHGIRGMRERARALGGDLQLSSRAGEGTTLVVTIPRHSEPRPETRLRGNPVP
jgi:two-component system sensor histidine kinase UhpB